MVKKSVSEKYFPVLKNYVNSRDERYLILAGELGRELVLAEIPPEEISEMHEEALVRLGEEYPNMKLIENARIISTPLMELLMAYGLAFRQWTEELKSYRNHLEELVKERTQEVDAFAYSISHDLRAPLRSIKGFAMALLEDTGDGLKAADREDIRKIINAANRMETLTKDLLSYSRLSRKDILIKTVDLDVVMKCVVDQLDSEIKEKNARVKVEKPLFQVMAEPAVLQSALMNLILNAVKFVSTEIQAKVRVFAEKHDHRIRLWVEDNGIGIAPENHERIFNVFERLHGIEVYPGTGIGLAIVEKGIKRMGGNVGVESGLGTGSRFWIELPEAFKD